MKMAGHRLGLPAGIALALLAWAAVPVVVTAEPSRPPEESGSASQGAESAPSSQFLTAYNSMSLADWLNEKGMPAEAADLYTEALDLFGKLAADYPQWQPTVVSFRINYCRGALKRLQGPGEDNGRRRPADDGRQAAMDDLKRAPDVGRQTSDVRQMKASVSHDRPLAVSNQQSAIRDLSPLNFKLQQAAVKERSWDNVGALAMYTAILEEFPREPWALKGACRCCLRLGRMDPARALIRQALALPSPDAEIYLLAALIECNAGRYQDALPFLRQALKQNGASPEAHAALGVALAAGGQMEEAKKEMKRALSLNPKLGDAYYNLARLSLRQKPTDHDTARVHYQNALRHGATPDPELDKLLAE